MAQSATAAALVAPPPRGHFIAGVVTLAIGIVLGPDFWDKLRALFEHGAKVQFASKE